VNEVVNVQHSVVVERGQRSPPALLPWSGMVLVVGGGLMVVATALHPSLETPTTILDSEVRLVAAHVLYTVSYLLVALGLPGLYWAAGPVRVGRLGLAGFLITFMGTALLAVSGNFGFIAPVLAAEAPATIDAISHYPPVVGLNAVAGAGFMVGFVLFGIALTKTVTLPRSSGILVAVGAPSHLIGFALAQFLSPTLWFIAVLGSVALGSGLAWAGYQVRQRPESSSRPLTAPSRTPPDVDPPGIPSHNQRKA